MGGFRIGSGFVGSDNYITSTADMELIPNKPDGSKYVLYKFSLMNDQDIVLRVNNSNNVLYRAYQGFSATSEDALIYSVVVINSGVRLNWDGCY